jgi:hypothetical protein
MTIILKEITPVIPFHLLKGKNGAERVIEISLSLIGDAATPQPVAP